MSMTEPAAKWSVMLFGLGAAAAIGGSIAHSRPGTILGCIAGGIAFFWWLKGAL